MFITYRRVSRMSVAPALAMVGSVAILFGVAAITAVVVATACGVALLRAIGAIRPAKRAVVVADDATIEGVVVRSSDITNQGIWAARRYLP
jgi:hypothetical protein